VRRQPFGGISGAGRAESAACSNRDELGPARLEETGPGQGVTAQKRPIG